MRYLPRCAVGRVWRFIGETRLYLPTDKIVGKKEKGEPAVKRAYEKPDMRWQPIRSSRAVAEVCWGHASSVRPFYYNTQGTGYAELYADGKCKAGGITFRVEEATFGGNIKYMAYNAWNFVRMVWFGLSDLVTGAVGIRDMSGVVGIVSVMNDVGSSAESVAVGMINILYLCAFIAINLAVMNLLPIPALDGGRIFALLVTWVIEKIIRRKLDPKYEGYIHTVGLVLLMGLMVVVMFNDVVRLING